MVISTRYAPPLSLARLRVRRQMNEIDLNDLLFTLEETNLFFAQNSQIKLTVDQLRQGHSCTQALVRARSLGIV